MDSHVYPDYVVPPSYDSLLGKVQYTVCDYYIEVFCIPELVIYVLTFSYYGFFHWFLFDIHGVFYIYFVAYCMGSNEGKGN